MREKNSQFSGDFPPWSVSCFGVFPCSACSPRRPRPPGDFSKSAGQHDGAVLSNVTLAPRAWHRWIALAETSSTHFVRSLYDHRSVRQPPSRRLPMGRSHPSVLTVASTGSALRWPTSPGGPRPLASDRRDKRGPATIRHAAAKLRRFVRFVRFDNQPCGVRAFLVHMHGWCSTRGAQ